MRIAFIGQKGIPAHGGGIERYAEDLARRLVKNGHEVIAYTRPYYSDKTEKEYQGIKLISLPSLQTKHLDAISHTFLACLDVLKRRVDVIHFQNIGPALMIWLPKILSWRRIKIVATLQSQDYYHQKWGRFARFSLRLGEWMLCRWSDEVIAVTKLLKDYIEEKYGREAHFIPNGSNINRGVKAKIIKEIWGLQKDSYIAYIGRLVRHKSVHDLINAYNRLLTRKKLVIVGDGSYSGTYVEELMSLAMDNPNIIFLGNQTGRVLRELYANAYLFVLPSQAEGLSLALLEAMSYRRPVLVSDIPENLEGVGQAGFTFRTGDIGDLAAKLNYILKNPKPVKTRGEKGHERVTIHYNWETIAKRIIDVYKNTEPTNLPFLLFKKFKYFFR